jgi:RNA polymerase sigma-70 factor (ECF subfamily)
MTANNYEQPVTRSCGSKDTTAANHSCSGTFEREVLPHVDAAYNLAHWRAASAQDVEDLVQEAYLLAFRFFPSFRGGDARVWLMKIVHDTCYTWLHVNRSLQDLAEDHQNPLPPVSQAPDTAEVVPQNISGTLMRKALEKLPLNFREVLILRELEGMSYREIAEITGRPTSTVISNLSRARGRLHQALTGLMNGDTVSGS